MTDLSVTPHHGCNCGANSDDLPTLDARQIPHAIRHAAILGAIDSLTPGQSLALIAPHNPLPLLSQVTEAHGGRIEVDYLEQGPEAWKLKFTRI